LGPTVLDAELDPEERQAIEALLRFWTARGESPFKKPELLASASPSVAERFERWFAGGEETLVLGEILLHRRGEFWELERAIRGSLAYLAHRILPRVRAAFGQGGLSAGDLERFVSLAYSFRQELLGGEADSNSGLHLFVTERLDRCGFGVLRADIRSVVELCDIFDEYDFHTTMHPRTWIDDPRSR